MISKFKHIPVMTKEVIKYLNLKPGQIIVDGTLGGGGHAKLIFKKIQPGGKLIGIDQDEEALKAATENLKDYDKNVILVKDNFRNLAQILEKLDIVKVDGILLDFGVSTHQLISPNRGFSFADFEENKKASLDMRMDQENEKTAAKVVNEYSKKALENILFNFGEEKYAKSIVREIINKRPLGTVKDLLEAIKAGTPPKYRFAYPKNKWASKTFRAIRLEVNNELEVIDEGLEKALKALKENGRLVVITFHSLEDRLVKTKFKEWAREVTVQPGFGFEEKRAEVKILTKKPIEPSSDEILTNPAATSAKIRAIVKK